jgi:poly[(R)-3-hydroxyalkanoate] polymerase subunit PhaC
VGTLRTNKRNAGSRSARGARRKPAAADRQIARALVEDAARNTLAANPLVGVRGRDVVAAATTLAGRLAGNPRALAGRYAKLAGEVARIAAGRSLLAPAQGDRRFTDAAWTGNAVFRRMLQSYVALGKTLDSCVDDAQLDATAAARARFAVSLLVDALAPTNFLAGNPAALKKLVDTRGTSVLRGLANLVDDAASRTGLPRQVDSRPFAVGRNVAATPGAVVHRNDVLELVQYAATTPQVRARPLVIVPPQINKFYVFDLAPDKSLVRYALQSGVQTFAVSWRNPTREHANWGIDAYVDALDRALDAVREITGSRDANVLGACSGGITLTALLGSLAARRERKVHAATLAVCVLDTSSVRDGTAGIFVTPATVKAAKAASRKRGVLEGTELARMFAWLRPNDLVWNYVVNNYLLGNEPPANDILFWNSDTTRLPAKLHADFLDLVASNAFVHQRKLRVRGRGIDVGTIGIDTYVVGGLTDHITTWQGVYRTARLYGGGRSTFVLSNGGHIQSLINPPGGARAWYMPGHARAKTPESWVKSRQKHEGSWWAHWRDWLCERSGPLVVAPIAPGSERHPPLAAAPGAYVLER